MCLFRYKLYNYKKNKKNKPLIIYIFFDKLNTESKSVFELVIKIVFFYLSIQVCDSRICEKHKNQFVCLSGTCFE